MRVLQIIAVAVFISFSSTISGQSKYGMGKGGSFVDNQWWLGFSSGANLTDAFPTETYSGFSPINYEPSEKLYERYKKVGAHAGINITYYHKGISFTVQPNYRRQHFGYSNDYAWLSSNGSSNSLEIKYDQQHQLDYFEIPLFIRYELPQGKLRPFAHIGGYYGALVNATKSIIISGSDYASGDAGSFEDPPIHHVVDSLFISSSLGLLGGIGVSYDFPFNIRVAFDVTYRYGMHNITNARNRFADNPVVGVGDAMDDLQLRSLSFNVTALFPLKYISKRFQSTK